MKQGRHSQQYGPQLCAPLERSAVFFYAILVMVMIVVVVMVIVAIMVIVPIMLVVPFIVVLHPPVLPVPVACKELLPIVMGSHPMRSFVRWPRPVAFVPLVVAAHRIPIPIHPNKIRPRSRRPHVYHTRRRGRPNPDPNGNLRSAYRHARQQYHPKAQSSNQALHIVIPPTPKINTLTQNSCLQTKQLSGQPTPPATHSNSSGYDARDKPSAHRRPRKGTALCKFSTNAGHRHFAQCASLNGSLASSCLMRVSCLGRRCKSGKCRNDSAEGRLK